MILRPLDPAPVHDQPWGPAWPVVERLQRQKYESCWMITQPSHAVLAGEIAAKLQGPEIPKLDPNLIRAIALHDAGWGIPDAQAIARSRSGQHPPPKSFLDAEVVEFVEAWTQSIEIAQSTGPAGGYIVSRHFWRLADHRFQAGIDDTKNRKRVEVFLRHEAERQKKLASQQRESSEQLELLTDVVQFCDLLSLYICSGASEWVGFPKYFGVTARMRVEDSGYRLEPELVAPGSRFGVAALRYPMKKDESGRQILAIIM